MPARALASLALVACAAGWAPGAPSPHRGAARIVSRGRISACDTGSDGDDSSWLNGDDAEVVEDAQLFRKKKGSFKPHVTKDDRDKLLYDVREMTVSRRQQLRHRAVGHDYFFLR